MQDVAACSATNPRRTRGKSNLVGCQATLWDLPICGKSRDRGASSLRRISASALFRPGQPGDENSGAGSLYLAGRAADAASARRMRSSVAPGRPRGRVQQRSASGRRRAAGAFSPSAMRRAPREKSRRINPSAATPTRLLELAPTRFAARVRRRVSASASEVAIGACEQAHDRELEIDLRAPQHAGRLPGLQFSLTIAMLAALRAPLAANLWLRRRLMLAIPLTFAARGLISSYRQSRRTRLGASGLYARQQGDVARPRLNAAGRTRYKLGRRMRTTRVAVRTIGFGATLQLEAMTMRSKFVALR